MSEFCEHIERDIGWARLTLEDAQFYHAKPCLACQAEQAAARTRRSEMKHWRWLSVAYDAIVGSCEATILRYLKDHDR